MTGENKNGAERPNDGDWLQVPFEFDVALSYSSYASFSLLQQPV
jgi:hypothetical protein